MLRQVIIEKKLHHVRPYISAIQALADSEKEALGFLTRKAIEDAVERQKVLIALSGQGGNLIFSGYLLYSGVYPNAKIQQISCVPSMRKSGIATSLIKAFVSELERLGYLRIRVEIASDLPTAIQFYERNGFERVRDRFGGAVRGRTIHIHIRELETDNLFSAFSKDTGLIPDIGIRNHVRPEIPMFAFDLNVFFDLVRQRKQSEQARRLFAEALGHNIRLAVADEFVAELRKTSKSEQADPVLQMALELPRLPKINIAELNEVADQVYGIVFPNISSSDQKYAQAKSDAMHIAHAAIARASAFITRDNQIIRSRNDLIKLLGIDIVTVEEILDLLPREKSFLSEPMLQGEGFSICDPAVDDLLKYFHEVEIPDPIAVEFGARFPSEAHIYREAVVCSSGFAAVGVAVIKKGVNLPARIMIHVRHEHHESELFAEYILDKLTNFVSRNAPTLVELVHMQGQSIISKAATTRGFHRNDNEKVFSKIALGRPATETVWPNIIQTTRRRTGLVLPDRFPEVCHENMSVKLPNGVIRQVRGDMLEAMLSSAIFVWRGQGGVIVPINRSYADDLLGSALQARMQFITSPKASFSAMRGYVNSPRTAKQMRPGCPIIFYESKRKHNGRGAAIAVARIKSSIIINKSKFDLGVDRTLVVESVDKFSKSKDVLITTFQDLMVFPNSVGFDALKNLGAVGETNLISAFSLSSQQAASILDLGWLRNEA